MPSVYLTNIVGTGTASDGYRPSFAGDFACLMIDPARGRAVVVSPADSVSGAGVTRLLTAPSWSDMAGTARASNVTAARRTSVNTWLAAGGYSPLPAGPLTWWDAVQHVAAQVNPAADLAATSCGSPT